MSQPDDVDKMVSDFLLELQILSNSLKAPGENTGSKCGDEKPVRAPCEVLAASTQNDAAAQPGPRAQEAGASSPEPPERDIRLILGGNVRPPLELTMQARRAGAAERQGRRRRLIGVLILLVCLAGVLYSLDPFHFTSRPHQAVPPVPSAGTSTAGPSAVIPVAPPPAPATPSGPARAEPATPAARSKPAGRTIGVSYRTVTAQLGNFFGMKKITRTDGRQEYRGQTSDRMASLVIIGNEEDISEASLTAGLATGDVGTAERNGGFALSFIQNIEPEWADAPNWITENLVNISKSETEYVEILRGERRIRLRWVKATEAMSISVRHKQQEEPSSEQ